MIKDLIQNIPSFASQTDDRIRIIITHVTGTQLHCGISYKVNDDVNFLHLAWHFYLSNKIEDLTSYYSICSKIPIERQRVIAAKCRLIWSKNNNPQTIPYSIFYENGSFTPEGLLCLDDNECGLTCATFVLAVFKFCGINLIETTNWISRPDDKIWHQDVISYLEKHEVDKTHIENVRREIGCSRFRPEEVAMSSTFDNIPETKEYIIDRGIYLREFLINKK